MVSALAALSLVGGVRAAEPTFALVGPLATKTFGKRAEYAGLIVGVLHNGQSRFYGFGTVTTPARTGRPTADTIFEIGSITKAFTGVLLADAIRRDEVTLNDPANKHLPPDLQIPVHPDGPATLLDLATHRSGLPRLPPDDLEEARDQDNPYADLTRDKLAAALKSIQPKAAGKQEDYSNLGAGLTAAALVHVTKTASFDELVHDRLARPLNLPDTAEALTGAQRARLAVGVGANRKPYPHWDFAALEGAGALKSTARDLLTFAAANLPSAPGPLAEACRTSHTKHRGQMGLFWNHTSLVRSRAKAVWHNGGTGAFRSMLVIVPEHNLAVVVLANFELDTAADILAFNCADRISRAESSSTPPKP